MRDAVGGGGFVVVDGEGDARGRWHRSGQGLRRGILLGLRETAKSIAQGQNSPPAQTADPAAITPSPAAQVVITPPPQQPGPMPPSSG